MEAEMMISRLRKGREKGKACPATSITNAALGKEDLSYLPLFTTVLGSLLLNVDLVIDIGMPLSLIRTFRH